MRIITARTTTDTIKNSPTASGIRAIPPSTISQPVALWVFAQTVSFFIVQGRRIPKRL